MTHPTNIVDLDSLILAGIVDLRDRDTPGFASELAEEYEQGIINDALIKSVHLMLENASVKGTGRIWDIAHAAAYNYKDIFQSQSERRCVIRVAFEQIREIISTLTPSSGGKTVEDLVEEMRVQMTNNPKGYGADPITLAS